MALEVPDEVADSGIRDLRLLVVDANADLVGGLLCLRFRSIQLRSANYGLPLCRLPSGSVTRYRRTQSLCPSVCFFLISELF